MSISSAGALRPVLRLEGVSKRFSGTYALRDVGLTVLPGQVHGLLGENGSGKSTLVKVLSGLYASDPGALIEMNGEPLPEHLGMSDRHRRGLGFVQQSLGLIPELSVAENLALSRLATEPQRLIRWPDVRRNAVDALARFGVTIDPRAAVSSLPPVQRASLAIVRALEDLRRSDVEDSGGKVLLVLDEPTVFLERQSVDRLSDILRTMTTAGHSVLLVSHRLDEILALTNYLTVLRDGRTVASVPTASVTKRSLVSMIVGDANFAGGVPSDYSRMRSDHGTQHNRAKIDILAGGRLQNFQIELEPGEVIGVTGLGGTGWEDLPYCITGAIEATGKVELNGAAWSLSSTTPRAAIQHGIGLVPANRLEQGCIGGLNLVENLKMLTLARYVKGGFLRFRKMRQDTFATLNKYDVRPSDPDADLSNLSGGNQQKLLLAKWLENDPTLLLLHEPTQGVDVGARAQIFEFIRESARGGTRTIIASSDHEELAELCSRVFVIYDGKISSVLMSAQVTQHSIGEACLSSGIPAAQSTHPDDIVSG